MMFLYHITFVLSIMNFFVQIFEFHTPSFYHMITWAEISVDQNKLHSQKILCHVKIIVGRNNR